MEFQSAVLESMLAIGSAHAKELKGVNDELLQREQELKALRAQVEKMRETAGKQRALWLRSPDCLLQVLSLVATNGHDAREFASLTRAFRGDQVLWGCIKDRCGHEGQTRLMHATRKADTFRMVFLLECGADVHKATTTLEHTALMDASRRAETHFGVYAFLGPSYQAKSLSVLNLLLQYGASKNAVDFQGKTAFQMVSHDTLKALLKP